ncbi:hypothetical protein K1T71_009097 [Dendrolimus kikuchii]|uniref:Uncharacterized protein n=1 Tax=Dendrolimus kikuchii TaxID=765133 RepID=A0ACC1CTN6_9NEOP|nr:hypothetical protein K1T71_009097 [Dendrolimus kikuchii]
MAENYAAVLHGPYHIKIEKWPMPEIDENEVLVKIACVGICGSDVKLYSSGKCGRDILDEPIVIGHEAAGVVVKVGSKVDTLKVGDRVAIEPTQPCRACEFCKRGKYNLCDTPRYCSSMGAPGNLCNYYKHVADFCHKYPPALEAVASGAIDLKKFITHHYSLEKTKEALDLAKSGDAMKIIIHVQN